MSRDRDRVLCKKSKDPCKICLQTVTARNGVQCQGACESWVHFRCLNYTPGKIKDIKAGLITVTCPCPDCKTTVPKEFITDEPYACNNTQCPANNPPSCEQFECQANELSRCLPPRCPPPGSLRSCSRDMCREYSTTANTYTSEPDDPCMQGYTVKTYCGDNSSSRKCPSRVIEPPCPGRDPPCPGRDPPCPGRDPPCPTRVPPCPGREQDMTQDVMSQMCKTVGDLAEQLNFLLDNMRGGR